MMARRGRMIATLLLLGLTTVAAVTDVRWQKIYNHTTYTGILAALALAGVRSLLEGRHSPELAGLNLWSRVGFTDSLYGLAACGGLMLACFALFRSIGGGDVKLVTMLGALLGLEQGLEALLWTFLAGGCLAICLLIWRVGALELADRAGKYLLAVARLGPVTPVEPDRELLKSRMYLAPCALAAAVIVVLEVL